MSTDSIHTALFGIALNGDDVIPLSDGLSLVRPNARLLQSRWEWAQGQGEMEEEEKASRYLVCEYPQWIPDSGSSDAQQRGTDRFYAGLMAIQIIKPIRTHGFVYRHQAIERRGSMQPGQWARMNNFSDAMLAQVPALIDRIQSAVESKDVPKQNALIMLQLGLEHFHPYIAGLLWMTGLEAIFDSGGKEEFKKELCRTLGARTLAFPNWHSKPGAPSYTVEEIAIPLFVLRNKLAHGADLRSAAADKKHPVDLIQRVNLIQGAGALSMNYAHVLSEAACYLLCQVLQKVL